ncbi:MAG: hypothetical protein JW772_00375, partial [Candidatus Diapherotrites archaeon]|nr:hypothetical protein [Candidatus Diapherotrites archaeon]
YVRHIQIGFENENTHLQTIGYGGVPPCAQMISNGECIVASSGGTYDANIFWGNHNFLPGEIIKFEDVKLNDLGLIVATVTGARVCQKGSYAKISCNPESQEYYFKVEYWGWVK